MVQEIKVLRSNISAREREKAERATLVQQDKLIKAKVGRGLLSCKTWSTHARCSLHLASRVCPQQAQGLLS